MGSLTSRQIVCSSAFKFDGSAEPQAGEEREADPDPGVN